MTEDELMQAEERVTMAEASEIRSLALKLLAEVRRLRLTNEMVREMVQEAVKREYP